MRPRRLRSFSVEDSDNDPLSGMANLFDVAMVFAVALMVAMVVNFRMTDFLSQDEVTVVKNPGKDNMEIIVKNGKEITQYQAAGQSSGEGQGRRIGTAYELENGQIIYIPE